MTFSNVAAEDWQKHKKVKVDPPNPNEMNEKMIDLID